MTITIQNNKLSATISNQGAELVSLQDAAGNDFLWDGNPAFWGKHSPILFPIVGTLKEGCYFTGDEKYELGRHGFARDMAFDLEASGSDHAHFSLVANEDTLAKYPFHFKLNLHYIVKDNVLTLRYKVENRGDTDMFFSLGAHPAFALDGDLEEYSIKMETNEQLHFNLLRNDLLSYETEVLEMTDGIFTLNESLFDRDALIFRHIPSKSLSLLKNGDPFLKVDFHDFEDLGIWKKTGAGFICIEPWLGYSDPVDANGNLAEKPGIITLGKGGTFEAAFHITLL